MTNEKNHKKKETKILVVGREYKWEKSLDEYPNLFKSTPTFIVLYWSTPLSFDTE